ncbi:MAG: hypothetical protein SPE73_00855 [Prevotella sp.]|nr:hypothetical protein [Prevotella sp.]MCI7688255.1 hypothetical protein [Prevotella sp.]MDY3897381.1 hypothetical protein [Prevotella sp.]MDY5084287.1 hypothetical protein [Prevotella sp.]
MADIDKLCGRYIVWSMVYIFILTIGSFIFEKLGLFSGLMYPVAVSAVFSIVVESADALVWRKVAKKSPDSLTTFYTAVSGFRMLLALATMLVCYIIVGRDAIMPYILVLLVFYFAMLAHHSIFFSRLSNGGKLNINNK